ncbi:MAG: hypothetical protein ACM36C_13540 [Acidobacteriota bacterium]
MPKLTNPTFTEPVWLELSQAGFLEAIRTLKPKGPLRRARIDLQIGLVGREAIFGISDRETRCDARGNWPGVARFAFQYATSFLKVKPAMDPVRIEFSDGRLRIESVRFPARWIGASALVTQLSMDAHFMGTDDPPPKPKRFCPACGKRAGVALDELTDGPSLTGPEAQVANALAPTAATHRCTRCGHRWIELGDPPQRPLRLV